MLFKVLSRKGVLFCLRQKQIVFPCNRHKTNSVDKKVLFHGLHIDLYREVYLTTALDRNGALSVFVFTKLSTKESFSIQATPHGVACWQPFF